MFSLFRLMQIEYNLSDIYADLLKFGVNSLAEGGRLVCWIPVNRQTYEECNLPKHSVTFSMEIRIELDVKKKFVFNFQNLNLIANCEQVNPN